MIRTNVYFPRKLHNMIEILAKREGVSMAELVRRFVTQGVTKTTDKSAQILIDMAKAATHSHMGNLAAEHDYFLYGEGRRGR